jgi:hypothetical protein
MSLALEIVCGKFGMELTDNPVTRVVAQKIIELAQRGVRHAPTLSEMTIQNRACTPRVKSQAFGTPAMRPGLQERASIPAAIDTSCNLRFAS